MTEEHVKRFERAMKKGFMSMLVLTILEKKPMHGYKIMQEIENFTLGMWKPSASTMYPLLDDLCKNDLIQIIEEEKEDKRPRKNYKLTLKGEETLKRLIQKQRDMMKAMRSIIITSFGLEEDDLFDDDIERIMFPPMIFRKSQKIPKEEKIKLLERRKRFVKMRIQKLEGFLQNIENELENLKNKK
ncbi:MAG: PadR family transcriptional regulator [Promethearchaeia archaeon]